MNSVHTFPLFSRVCTDLGIPIPVVFATLAILASLAFGTSAPVPAQEFTGPRITKATEDIEELPSEAGQFWMVYDITPYTRLYPALASPEQPIVNWILHDTGRDFWHKEPFGVFSAGNGKIYVYHNEKVQQYISNVLDRFLNEEKRGYLFQVQIVLLDTPDWRKNAAQYMRPYPVNKEELSGWLIGKANIQAFLQTLSRRSDYTELNASRNVVPNAETFGWVLPAPTQSYIRDIQVAPSAPQGYVTDTNSIDEGYRIEVTPLVSTNGEQVEVLLSCDSTVVEKMLNVPLKVPTASAPRQQLTAEVPQIARMEISDKISFPIDQVFLLDFGMIPIVDKASEKQTGLTKIVSGRPTFRNVLVLIQKSDLSSTQAGANPATSVSSAQIPQAQQAPVQQRAPVQQQVPAQQTAPVQQAPGWQQVPAQQAAPVQQAPGQQVPAQQAAPVQPAPLENQEIESEPSPLDGIDSLEDELGNL